MKSARRLKIIIFKELSRFIPILDPASFVMCRIKYVTNFSHTATLKVMLCTTDVKIDFSSKLNVAKVVF